MSLFLVIGIGVVALMLLGVFYGVLTDPARIDEEEDQEVAHETPAERHGFLRSYRHKDTRDQVAEESRTGYGDDASDVNDL